MMRLTALMFCLALAACGADGEPIAPSPNDAATLDQNGIYPGVNGGLFNENGYGLTAMMDVWHANTVASLTL